MAVSRRLRFEILRRDGHTCRYCGASAPDAKLTVDHVLPVALGGSDEPENLTTACTDCNAGKSSIGPDQAVVADVSNDAARLADAMRIAVNRRARLRDEMGWSIDAFNTAWAGWTYGKDKLPVPRDAGWQDSIERFLDSGLCSDELIDDLLPKAMRSQASPAKVWVYFCGMAWRSIRELQAMALEIAAETKADDGS